MCFAVVIVAVPKAMVRQIEADGAQGYDFVAYHGYGKRRYFELVDRKYPHIITVPYLIFSSEKRLLYRVCLICWVYNGIHLVIVSNYFVFCILFVFMFRVL